MLKQYLCLLQQQGGYGDSKYGFSANSNGHSSNGLGHGSQGHVNQPNDVPPYQCSPMTNSPPHSPLYGTGNITV